MREWSIAYFSVSLAISADQTEIGVSSEFEFAPAKENTGGSFVLGGFRYPASKAGSLQVFGQRAKEPAYPDVSTSSFSQTYRNYRRPARGQPAQGRLAAKRTDFHRSRNNSWFGANGAIFFLAAKASGQ